MTENITQSFSDLKKSFDSKTIDSLNEQELVELARMIYDAGEIYDCPEGTFEANCTISETLQSYLECEPSHRLKKSYENDLRNTVWACLWGAECCASCEQWRQDVTSVAMRNGSDVCLCDDCNEELQADLEHEAHLDWYFYGGRSL